MTDKHRTTDEQAFDHIVEDVRRDAMNEAAEDAATERVWQHLVAEVDGTSTMPISSCEDYQALIPALLRDELSEGRALLVRDHTRECIPCRKALMRERTGQVEEQLHVARPGWGRRFAPMLRMAAAVIAAIGIGVLGFNFGGNFLADRALRAEVLEIDGALQLVDSSKITEMAPGRSLVSHQTLRTAKLSGAMVALADGSVIEMAERSEISLRADRHGTTIDLGRGNIIVHAAEQRTGRLYVATDECLVAVKGTIFSVAHGIKGSRVSVIEGEVEVRHGAEHALLNPGQQVTTDARLAAVSVESEIAWSRNAEQHMALLRELTSLKRELGKAVDVAEERTSTRLLDLAPVDTVIYGGIPNLTEGLVAARDVFESRLASSPVLADWWNEHVVAEGIDREIDEALNRLQPLGEAMGNEIVVAVSVEVFDGQGAPLIMALLDDPADFSSVLAEEVARLNGESPEDVKLVIVDDPLATVASPGEMFLWIDNDLFAASTAIDELRDLALRLSDGAGSDFLGTELHSRLASAYAGGVEWVFGLDFAVVMAEATSAHDADDTEIQVVRELGLLDARTLIVQRSSEGDVILTQAELDFDGDRTGMAGWLAEPAPMGSLDFISADASMAAALVSKDAAVIFDEVVATLASVDPDAVSHMEDFEATYGFDLRADLAATLGGEVAFALDGPMLPIPSWKVIVEVYDPATLYFTIERAVTLINIRLMAEGHPIISIERFSADGLDYLSVGYPVKGTQIVCTVVDGFLVAAPSRALIEQALSYRNAGLTLTDSAAFRNAVSPSEYTDCSALSYRNFEQLADSIPSAALKGLPEVAMDLLQEGTAPSLFFIYGERDRILLNGSGGSLIGLAPLFGLNGLMDGSPELLGITTEVAAEVSS